MKAAQIKRYGGKEVLEVTIEAPKPQADKGEIVIKVHAAGVNPFDWKVREGLARQMAELNFPATLGGDFAGVVAELGDGVSEFKVGDEVYGQANALGGEGSFAEFVPAKATTVAVKPKTVDFAVAAALPLAGTSAYQALVDHLNLQSGQKILIHGAAGGIGSFAVQIAKHLSAYVAGTAASNDIEFVKNLGADEVIDYKTEDFTSKIRDYDAVFDTVGSDTYKKSYQVLKPGGMIVSMLEPPDEELMKQYNVKALAQSSQATTERLTRLAELIERGAVKAQVDKVFSLDQAAEALEYLKTGSPRGKVVIKVKN